MRLRRIDLRESSLASTDTSRVSGAHFGGTKWFRRALFVTLVGAGLMLSAREVIEMMLPPLPPPPDIPIRESIWDGTPVWFTVTRNWKRLPFVAPVIAVRSDETLWRKMYLRNWDTVPLPFREEALETMFAQYQYVLADPKVWDRMQAKNWDLVPQPIRALAFGHMTEYWNGYYDVGIRYDIPRRLMADTLHAIVMAESWFEHRAVNTSVAGNRDFGVHKLQTIRANE